jgi:hypothetical protein
MNKALKMKLCVFAVLCGILIFMSTPPERGMIYGIVYIIGGLALLFDAICDHYKIPVAHLGLDMG